MRKVLLILACFALLSVAAKPAQATISLASDDGTNVTFAVDLGKQAERYAYEVWVAVWCYDSTDTVISSQWQPVTYPDGPPSGSAGPFTRGPFVDPDGTVHVSARCEAYAWHFPATHDPISNVLAF